ncbi:MAG: anthranilate synthase component I [Candidatus Nanopelagicales bacterium]
MYSNQADGVIYPTFSDFETLAETKRVIPVVAKVLADGWTAIGLYEALTSARPGTFLLESAEGGKTWSRYSFVGVHSKSTLLVKDAKTTIQGEMPVGLELSANGFESLEALLSLLKTERTDLLPPFTGGLVGMMSYDSVRWLEKIPNIQSDELDIPDMAFLLTSDLAVIDHWEGTLWIIANAINFDATEARLRWAYDDACSRIATMLSALQDAKPLGVVGVPAISDLNIDSNVQKDHFFEKVNRCKEYIKAGDAFQIVISQRFKADLSAHSFDVYRMLRAHNPSPYMYYIRFSQEGNDSMGWFDIVGSSPEALVKLENGMVEMHPIAGTRKRGGTSTEDENLEQDLLQDEKERSEHLMLVDLGRNDLGRIATPGTVEVSQFMTIERYSHVMHLVSKVRAHLDESMSAVDVVRATFPAGTLSGAPKPRAMEIIEELEPTRRGLYGGVVGYFDFAGNMDLAIAIRTALIQGTQCYVQAGAGIVADSDPESEYLECINKANAVLRAIESANQLKDQ